jgi:hypothetical protein
MNGFGEKGKSESAAERVSDAARQVGDAVQELAREAGTQADRAATALYEQGTTASGYLGRFAAEQPITALLLAAAFGYGLAYLIHRSD